MSVRSRVIAELSLYEPTEAIKRAQDALHSETEFSDLVKILVGLGASSARANRPDMEQTIIDTLNIVFYLRGEIRKLQKHNETR